MAVIRNLDAEFGANYIANNSLATGGTGITFSSLSTQGSVLTVNRAVLSNVTAPLIVINIGSTASAPAIMLEGQSFVSCTTIAFTTGGVAGTGALRVLLPDGATYGWIPILPSGAVTGAGRA